MAWQRNEINFFCLGELTGGGGFQSGVSPQLTWSLTTAGSRTPQAYGRAFPGHRNVNFGDLYPNEDFIHISSL